MELDHDQIAKELNDEANRKRIARTDSIAFALLLMAAIVAAVREMKK